VFSYLRSISPFYKANCFVFLSKMQISFHNALVGIFFGLGQLVASQTFEFIGCADETGNPTRSLAGSSITTANMTNAACQSFCHVNDFAFAGTEFGDECYCGDGLVNNATVGQDGCNIACAGNSTDICGGVNRISVYQDTSFVPDHIVDVSGNYTEVGCFSEPSNQRAIQGSVVVSSSMTVDFCTETCASMGFPFAGVEFADECYCGNGLANGTAPVADATCTTDSLKCAGDPTLKTFCGGADLLIVYHNAALGGTLPAKFRARS